MKNYQFGLQFFKFINYYLIISFTLNRNKLKVYKLIMKSYYIRQSLTLFIVALLLVKSTNVANNLADSVEIEGREKAVTSDVKIFYY